jgi:hypothetical protein
MSNSHIAKPSYIGDLLNYEFPSSEEISINDESKSRKSSPKIIERAGSIFIKSGIPKVTPFPTSEDEANFEKKYNQKYGNLKHNLHIPLDNSEENLFKEKEIENHVNENKEEEEEAEKPELEKNEKIEEEQDSRSEINSLKQIEEFKQSISTKSRSNTEESQYEESLKNSEKADLLRKRPSLKPVHSISSNQLLVNPYLRRSLLRKHKNEVINDEILSKRIKSIGSIGSNKIKPVDEMTPLIQKNIEITNTEGLQIPRRSSKRLKNISNYKKPESKDISRKSTISGKKSKLNSTSLRSIQTLASDIRISMHDKNAKSVDFASLDKLLEELLELKSSSSTANSIDSSLSIRKIKHDVNSEENNDDNSRNGDEKNTKDNLSSSIVEPFHVHKSISRKSSLQRSLPSLSMKLKNNSNTINDYNKPLPKIFDNSANDTKESEVCELKRSNAVRRKSRLVAGLLILIEAIKKLGKKLMTKIKVSKNKIISFKSNNKLINRKTSIRGKKIGEPKLIDIHNTTFRTHNIHKTETKKTTPISEVTKNKLNEKISFATLVPIDKSLSTINSEDENIFELDNNTTAEKDQLIILWKHYLSQSIMNRVDMKFDISKLNHFERVKSIQSNSSRRKSINYHERTEIQKIMDKYIESSESITSTTSRTSTSIFAPLSVGDLNTDSLNVGSELSLSQNKELENKGTTRSTDSTSTLNTNTSSSTGWSTIGTESSEEDRYRFNNNTNNHGQDDHSSISTIEEEDTDFNQSISSKSSISSLDDVYDDEYSSISDVNNNNNNNNHEHHYYNERGVGIGQTGTILSKNISKQSSLTSRSIKHSLRVMNLQSVLKKGKDSIISKSGRSVSSQSYMSESSFENSDAFSFQPSVRA